MSNLGNYQRLVELAKAADGPVKLGIYVVAGSLLVGTAVGVVAGPAIKKVAGKGIKAAKRGKKSLPVEVPITFTAADGADAGKGLQLRAGDEFRVLSRDGDAVLIEVLGDPNNPYVVSSEILQAISDFTPDKD